MNRIHGLEIKLQAQEQKLNQQYSEILKILKTVGSKNDTPTLQNSQSSGSGQNSGIRDDPGEGLL